MNRTPNDWGERLERPWSRVGLMALSGLSLWLTACSTAEPPRAPAPARDAAQPGPAASTPAHLPAPAQNVSLASNAKDYRLDAARHVYGLQKTKVFKGRLPPMLYAIGVLNVDIDRQGQIQALRWTRAPEHAPEVMAEIEHLVRTAAPFPAPTRLGKVTYTDVWLWDKSGRFQLDTLTEGQD